MLWHLQVLQQTLRITSFRVPLQDDCEIKTLASAMLVRSVPADSASEDVDDYSLFVSSKRDCSDARQRCDASLAFAVDDMTGVVGNVKQDPWQSSDQVMHVPYGIYSRPNGLGAFFASVERD
jgi:hypothetical protein